jgi:hypothetical protein
LRHEAKKGVDHFVEALERQMPDGGCTLHFPSRTGKAAVPFFNAGTDALAFLREIGKAVLYGDPGENCKKKLVLLFKSQVCNAAGFEIQSALSEWLDPLGDKRLEIQVISSAQTNQISSVRGELSTKGSTDRCESLVICRSESQGLRFQYPERPGHSGE